MVLIFSGFEIDVEGVLTQAGRLDHAIGSPDAGIRRLDAEVRRGSGKNHQRIALVQALSGEGVAQTRQYKTLRRRPHLLLSFSTSVVGVAVLPPTFEQVILHVYVEDEQRLRCAVSGGVEALIDTIRTKAPQMQVRAPTARMDQDFYRRSPVRAHARRTSVVWGKACGSSFLWSRVCVGHVVPYLP